jgi:hypothetical protein
MARLPPLRPVLVARLLTALSLAGAGGCAIAVEIPPTGGGGGGGLDGGAGLTDAGPPPLDAGGGACDDVLCETGSFCCDACPGLLPPICLPEGIPCDFACPDPSACFTNRDCAADEFCQRTGGNLCDPLNVTGQCAPRPEACPENCPGVCGCDGLTYCNACLANAAGVNVAEDGTCEAAATCNGATCAPGQFCALSSTCRDEGGCEARPTSCPTPDPDQERCGCDGRFYASVCEANRLGVSTTDLDRCEEASVDALCARLCVDVPRECFGAEPGPDDPCTAACLANLEACSRLDRSALERCLDLDCFSIPICLSEIACVTGAGP